MKVFVLGATGGTGLLIVRYALAKGHTIVALVRSKALALDLPGAELVEGDARDEGALSRPWRVAMLSSARLVLA